MAFLIWLSLDPGLSFRAFCLPWGCSHAGEPRAGQRTCAESALQGLEPSLPHLSWASRVSRGVTAPHWVQLFYVRRPREQHTSCGYHTVDGALAPQFPPPVPPCSITCFLESESKRSGSGNRYICLNNGSHPLINMCQSLVLDAVGPALWVERPVSCLPRSALDQRAEKQLKKTCLGTQAEVAQNALNYQQRCSLVCGSIKCCQAD